MSDFVLSVAMRFLFADAVSACRSVYFADDGSIVTTLSRVDPVVVATGTDLEGMTVSGIAIHATPGAVPTRVDDRLEASAAIDTRHRGDHVECSDRAIRTRRVICPCLGTIGMMIVKNYVAPSRIHGVGLFSGEDIQCDQKIFVVNDRIDIVMSKNAMQAYGPEFVRFMVIFAWEDFHSHDMHIRR